MSERRSANQRFLHHVDLQLSGIYCTADILVAYWFTVTVFL